MYLNRAIIRKLVQSVTSTTKTFLRKSKHRHTRTTKNLISKQARLDPGTQNTHQELVKIKVCGEVPLLCRLLLSAGGAYTVFLMSQKSEGKLPLKGQQRGEADEASEVEGLEVEYLLLALDFGEILFLLAGFGPL